MGIKTSTLDNGIGLIQAKGSLVGGDETLELRQAVAGFLEREYSKLLIDLGSVTYINSTGIALIVRLLADGRKDRREVRACGLSPHYVEIFQITRLSDYMRIFDDQASATAAGVAVTAGGER